MREKYNDIVVEQINCDIENQIRPNADLDSRQEYGALQVQIPKVAFQPHRHPVNDGTVRLKNHGASQSFRTKVPSGKVST